MLCEVMVSRGAWEACEKESLSHWCWAHRRHGAVLCLSCMASRTEGSTHSMHTGEKSLERPCKLGLVHAGWAWLSCGGFGPDLS